MLSYRIRLTPAADPLALDDDLLQWPQRVRLAVEDRSFQFRTEQIQLTLDNADGRYAAGGARALDPLPAAGIEIALYDGPSPLWAGLIDPTDIQFDDIRRTVNLRVLQHGSYLNAIRAGLRDELPFADPHRRWRWTARQDQWLPQIDQHGKIQPNIRIGNTDVFLAPRAYDTLTDPLQRIGWQKIYRYDSSGRIPGAAEQSPSIPSPYPGDQHNRLWTGKWMPWFRPDYFNPSADWFADPLLGGELRGELVINPAPLQPLNPFTINDIVADLIAQYNERYPDYPLQFVPDLTARHLPPIETFIPIAEREDIQSVDLLVADNWLFIAVVWVSPQAGAFQFTIYRVSNYSLLEEVHSGLWENHNSDGWPGPPYNPGAPRFARTWPRLPGHIYFYRLSSRHIGGLMMDYFLDAVQINTATGISFPLGVTYRYQDSDHERERNRSVDFSNGFSGLYNKVYPDPEINPLREIRSGGGFYQLQQNRLIYAGPLLLEKLAFDYVDTSLARILTDLAVVTDSIFYVTAGRQLFFRSRRSVGRPFKLSTNDVNSPVVVTRRTLVDEDPPAIQTGIQIAAAHRAALAEYYQTLRFAEQVTESKINVERLPLLRAVRGRALQFDGLDDYVEVPHTPTLNLQAAPFTIDGYLRRTQLNLAAISYLLDKGTFSGITAFHLLFGFGSADGALVFRQSIYGSVFETTVTANRITDLNWHYFVCENDGKTAKIYLDDVLAGTDTTPAIGPLHINTIPLTVGCGHNGTTRDLFAPVELRSLRILQRLLTPQERQIRQDVRWLTISNEPALIIGFETTEINNQTLADLSSFGHHGSVNGPLLVGVDLGQPALPQPGDKLVPAAGLPTCGINPLLQELTLIGDDAVELFTRTAPTA